jgi:cation:H+ antiporter
MHFIEVIFGFVLLIFGAKWLVNGASSLAKNFNIPNIVIGLTVVAFGTSAPELVVNILASMNGNSQMVLGNVVGSNIFNIAIILGISAVIRPIVVKRNTHWLEMPFNILASLALIFLSADVWFDVGVKNIISKSDGAILMLFFAIFLVYNVKLAFSGKEEEHLEISTLTTGKAVLFFFLGLAGLIIGGNFIVDGASAIAKSFGIEDRIIGLTVLAFGTSLPELATSIVAVRKGNTDMAIGGVLGSNLFNIFHVLGISAMISPIDVDANSFIDLGFNLLLGFLLFFFVFTGKNYAIGRKEGMFFILMLMGYTVFLVLNP